MKIVTIYFICLMKANYTVQSRDTKMYNALNFICKYLILYIIIKIEETKQESKNHISRITENTQNHRTVAQYTV